MYMFVSHLVHYVKCRKDLGQKHMIFVDKNILSRYCMKCRKSLCQK